MASKKYNEFTAGTPAASDIVLFGNPTTGALKKVAISGLTNIYSLTERAVGTWVDGKTIYQKTWSLGAGNNSAVDLTGLTTAAIDNIIDAVIFGTNISTGSWSIFTIELTVSAGQYQVYTTTTNNKIFATVFYTKV